MRIGILQADVLPDDFDELWGGLIQIIDDFLEGDAFDYKVFDLPEGQFPDSVNEMDAYILTGARYSVYEKTDLIGRQLDFIRDLLEHDKPIVGICYGHQAVALAMGGKVEPNPNRWEVGITEVKFSPGVLQELGIAKEHLNLPSFHHDHITELPSDAKIIAHNDFSPVQAYRLKSALCFQAHPEFSNDILAYFINSGRNDINDAEKQAALDTLSSTNDRAVIGKIITKFFLENSK